MTKDILFLSRIFIQFIKPLLILCFSSVLTKIRWMAESNALWKKLSLTILLVLIKLRKNIYQIGIFFIVKYWDTSFHYIQHYLIQNDHCTSPFSFLILGQLWWLYFVSSFCQWTLLALPDQPPVFVYHLSQPSIYFLCQHLKNYPLKSNIL